MSHESRAVAVRFALYALLVLCAALTWIPVAGRPIVEWLPVVCWWLWRSTGGQLLYRRRIVKPRPAGNLALPGDMARLREYRDPESKACMIHDPRQATLTVVCEVTHPAFVLLDPGEQERRVTSWGRVLATVCRSGRIATLQVLERTLPDSGSGLAEWWSEHGTADGSWAATTYAELIERAGPAGERHATTISLSLDMKTAARQIRTAGGGIRGAAAVLRQEMATLTAALRSADSQRLFTALDPAVLRDLGLRAARIWERLSDSGRAEGRYQAVLELEAENQDALSALERIYRNRGDVVLLAETLLKRAGLTSQDDDQKRKLLAEAARLYEGPLADEDRAVEAWRKVLEVEESDAQALTALAALYERTRRWEDLVTVLNAQARFTDAAAQRAQLKGRVAELLSDQIDDTERAISAYRDLLDLQPTSLKALTALEGLYARQQQFTDVQEILTRRLSAVTGPKDQIPIYKKLATLAVEKLRQPEEAIGYLQQVLDLNPVDGEAQTDLEKLLEQTEKWYDLVEVLQRHADAAARARRSDEEVALLIRAAEIWERKLQSPDSSTEVLERVLSRDPNNVRALTSLARIYEAQKDLDRCKQTLERAVRLARGGAETAELYYRLGRLEGERQGEGAAEPYYERALQADPTNVDVAEALEEGVALLKTLGPTEIAHVLQELPSDDAALFVAELPEELREQLLDLMKVETSTDVQELLSFAEGTAGRIMTPAVFALNEDLTVGESISNIQSASRDVELVYYLYIVDDRNHLVGVSSLRQLLLVSPTTPLKKIMSTDVISVRTDAPQEEVARVVEGHQDHHHAAHQIDRVVALRRRAHPAPRR